MNRSPNQNLRITTILAWAYWTRDWPGLFLGVIAALVLPGAIVAGSIAKGHWEKELPFVQSILSMVFVYWTTILCLGSVLLLNLGKPRPHYTLPAPSWMLVVIPMACGMLTMFVQYAIVATILNTSLNLEWPILGPGLLAALLLAWCYAVFWSTSNSLVLRLIVWLASFVVLALCGPWEVPMFGEKMQGFLASINSVKALRFGLATLACVGVGTAGFASLRHGSAIDLPRLIDKLSDHFRFMRAAPRAPFSSPRSAQFWSEWMDRGYALPLTTTLLGTVALGLACYVDGQLDNRGQIRFAISVSPLFFLQLVLIGFFWGYRSPGYVFGNFGGSRPLSDGQIANAILKSATFSLIVSTLIWFAFLLLAGLILSVRRGMIGPFGAVSISDFGKTLCGIMLWALMAWSAVGQVTSLALAGRRVMRDALLLAFGAWIVGLLLYQYLPGNIGPAVAMGYAWGCFVLYLLACGAAFVASWRWNLISNRTLWLAVLLASVAFDVAYCCGSVRDWPSHLVVLSRCSLIPLPLAAAPLAVYFNRHR